MRYRYCPIRFCHGEACAWIKQGRDEQTKLPRYELKVARGRDPKSILIHGAPRKEGYVMVMA